MHMEAHAPANSWVVQLDAFGSDHFALVQRALRPVKPWEVRIRVRAASLNFLDLLVAQGQLSSEVSEVTLPLVPLSDCAGEIVEIGSEVHRFKIGDRVSPASMPGWKTGPFAAQMISTIPGAGANGVLGEYFTGDQHGFVHIPEAFSFAEAATLPCAALTAWNALFEQSKLRPGQTVLVQGFGGVSTFALQFAAAIGARVIAITGSDVYIEKLRSLGALHVINYKREPEWSRFVLEVTAGEGVDHIIETVGAATLDQSIKAAAVGGTISLIGALSGATGNFETLPILTKALHIQGIIFGSVEMFERMNWTIDSLGIEPVIDCKFDVQEIAAAFEYLQAGRHFGNVVIDVAADYSVNAR